MGKKKRLSQGERKHAKKARLREEQQKELEASNSSKALTDQDRQARGRMKAPPVRRAAVPFTGTLSASNPRRTTSGK